MINAMTFGTSVLAFTKLIDHEDSVYKQLFHYLNNDMGS